MSKKITIYSIHSNTLHGGVSTSKIFDNYEKTIFYLENNFVNFFDNHEIAKTWLQKIQGNIMDFNKGSFIFTIPDREDEYKKGEKEKILISIATLPII